MSVSPDRWPSLDAALEAGRACDAALAAAVAPLAAAQLLVLPREARGVALRSLPEPLAAAARAAFRHARRDEDSLEAARATGRALPRLAVAHAGDARELATRLVAFVTGRWSGTSLVELDPRGSWLEGPWCVDEQRSETLLNWWSAELEAMQ